MQPAPPPGAAELLFVGNATLLIRYGELKLLTDPNFLHRGQYAYLGKGLLSRRLREPALRVEDLPPDLDAVVLSHLHGDHWDRIARRNLPRSLPIVTTPHASRRLQGLHGFSRATGLPTWHDHVLVRGGSQVRITALPGRHGPGPVDFLLPPVMGSLLEFGDPGGTVRLRLYISGDTLMFPGVHEIARLCPDIHLAVVHLGGTTLPGGLLVTMDALQGADLVSVLRPRRVLPVHYDDYTVMKSPLSDFLREAERPGFPSGVLHCPRGERVTVDAAGPVEAGAAGPGRP
ncbi:MBL fold metallo-hydrolase [Streptomyces fenghuangensis]|uniref:MBL fold metallo-hydrolase n=1 Tax=Streptomyces chitinivorans TaxID=1257027 RepID=A0ABW7HS08_9ACTN|nr:MULTISPECIES: MBL fold metallo-hydrolase [Streptomyces]MCG3043508.1 MBL fold metallo-hydrolase [Streptomyces sp. ICN903]MDH2410996.1 MBL fold metallo-hydrolase [Streptomyces chitinivorans]